MIEIKINGVQGECSFYCATGEILSDDIRRALVILYRAICEASHSETADKGMEYIVALIGSGTIKRDYEHLLQTEAEGTQ